MKKSMVSILLAAVMVFMAGCRREPGKVNDKKEDQITLEWFQYQAEYKEQIEYMAEIYERDHPDIKISVEVLGDDYYKVLQTRAASGNMPDIFMTSGYHDNAVYKDYMMDLSDEPFAEQIKETARECVSLEGKIVGMPVQMSGNGIVYNKEIFEKYQLKIPETITELEQVCRKLGESGITSFVNQFKEEWLLAQFLDYGFAGMEDPNVYMEELSNKTVTVSKTQNMRDLINVLDLMLVNGQENPLETGWNEAAVLFSTGEYAMMFEGVWTYGMLEKLNPDIKVGLFALPLTNDVNQTKLTTDVNGVWHIAKASKHPDEAKELLNWIADSEAGRNVLLKECQVIPAMEGMRFQGVNPLSQDVMTYMEHGKTMNWSFPLWPDGYYLESGRRLQEYIADTDIGTDAALGLLDQLWTGNGE